ncbi:MAG: right-handed parallel beta-helix repeat-containing protein [Bacteroidota bacterium]
MKKIYFLFFLFLSFSHLNGWGKVFYVGGNGQFPVFKELPSVSLFSVVEMTGPGDTIYLRGGIYYLQKELRLEKSGKAGQPISMLAYPGESPILDGSRMERGGLPWRNIPGIREMQYVLRLRGASYWYIRGIEICNGEAGGGWTGGMVVDENSGWNRLEQLNVHHNHGAGIVIHGPHNLLLNSDSHHNVDIVHQGENADGIACSHPYAVDNVIRGCRSWQNSDDGFDIWNSVRTTLDSCWSFRNGYNDQGDPWGARADGNAFKLGIDGEGNLIRNCLAWSNLAIGFDYNWAADLTVLNCTAWNNGAYNYRFDGQDEVLRNCISFEEQLLLERVDIKADEKKPVGDEKHNSWTMDPPIEVKRSDFQSLDDTGASGLRQKDGRLPDLPFLKLHPGSNLIDRGVDVGLPYHGKAPDLGAFELR